MRFPADELRVTLLIAYGADVADPPATWPWVDYSNDWEVSAPVTVTDTRSDGGTALETLSTSITVRNQDGQHTPDEDLGITEGTPVWMLLDGGYGQQEFIAGFTTSHKPVWPGRNGEGAFVVLSVRGVLGRLETGNPPELGPLDRAMVAAAPFALWPLNDGQDAQQAASALPGGVPLIPAGGVPRFAEHTGPAGAKGPFFAAIADAAWTGALSTVVIGGSASGWSVGGWAYLALDEEFASGGFALATWRTDGTLGVAGWQLRVFGSGEFLGAQMLPYINNAGVTAIVAPSAFDLVATPGQWVYVQACANQDTGTQVTLDLYMNGVLLDSVTSSTWTIGRITSITAGHDPELDDYAYGPPDYPVGLARTVTASVAYLAVYNSAALVDVTAAGLGYPGEPASDRIARVLGEVGVPVEIVAGDSEPMGPQQPGTVPAILLECEATDGGRLSEAAFGFRWRPRSTLLNQEPALVIDAAAGQLSDPFDPVRDLSRVRNEWTVSRPGGSSATYKDAAHQRRGRFPDGVTINPAADERLMQHASWRTAATTVPGMRYPGATVDLADAPELLRAWQALRPGDLVVIADVRAVARQHPPGDVPLLYEGRSQTLTGTRSLVGTLYASPAQPLTVGLLDDLYLGRLDGDAQLVDALPAGQVGAVGVQLNDATLWTTDLGHFPMLIRIRGEFIRLSSISGATSPQTFVIAERAVNGIRREHPAGAPVRVVDALRLAL